MEALWPDQTPKSALNSLHQTIFFLRRELEPWYEDGATADYVHMDTEARSPGPGTVPGRQRRLRPPGGQTSSGRAQREPRPGDARPVQRAISLRSSSTRSGQTSGGLICTRRSSTWLMPRPARCVAERRFGEVVEVLTPVSVDPTAFDLRGRSWGASPRLARVTRHWLTTEVWPSPTSVTSGCRRGPYDELVRSHECYARLPVRTSTYRVPTTPYLPCDASASG